jgi:hypothetical protein
MKWIEALKKWNEGKPHFCIPRKGTEDYHAVMKIMKPAPVQEPIKEPVKKPKKKSFIVKEANPKKNLEDAKRKLNFDPQMFARGVLSKAPLLERSAKTKPSDLDKRVRPRELYVAILNVKIVFGLAPAPSYIYHHADRGNYIPKHFFLYHQHTIL